jgi:hypothetical protein
MSDTDGDVVFKARFEGVDQSLQSFALLQQAIDKLAGGAVSGATGNMPGNAPAGAPRPPDPYSSQTPFGYSGGPSLPSGGWAAPGAAAGIYAPPAPGVNRGGYGGYGGNGGGGYGGGGGGMVAVNPPPFGAGGGSYGGPTALMQIRADLVQIVATTVQLHGANMTGGAAAGGMLGSGASGQGGGGGQMPNGQASPLSPLAPPSPVPPAEASWSKFVRAIAGNPTLGGIAQAGLSNMPVGSMAVLGMAAEASSVAANYAFASQRPGFNNQTYLMQQSAAGQFVNSASAAAQSRAADMRGEIAGQRALVAPFASLPLIGGLFSSVAEGGFHAYGINVEGFQDKERAAALAEAKGSLDQQKLFLSRVSGYSARDLPDNNDWAALQSGGARALMPFGTAAANAGVRFGAHGALHGAADAFGPEAVVGVASYVASMAARADMSGLRHSLPNFTDANGRPDQATLMHLGQMASLQGDLGGLSALRPALSKEQADTLAQMGGTALDRQRKIELSQLQYSIGSQTGAGYQSLGANLRDQQAPLAAMLADAKQAQASAPPQLRADLDKLILQLQQQIASIPRQIASVEYGQRGQMIGADSGTASLRFQQTLYGGGDGDALSSAYSGRASQARRQASLAREQSRRTDIYNPSEIAAFKLQAEQGDYEANVGIARERSQTLFGLAGAGAGVTGARAGAAMTQARLFGGPAEQAGAVGQQIQSTAEQLRAIQELLARGNLSREEMLRYQAQQIGLQTQLVSLNAEQVRGQARQEIGVAQGNLSIAGTQMGTAFATGVGGVAGVGLAIGVTGKAQESVKRAQAYVDLLKKSGVAADNEEMIAARQGLAQAQQTVVSNEVGEAHVPFSLGLTRSLSGARYAADVLQSVPGSYGNLRGALQQQVGTLEKMGGEKQAQYAKVVAQYGSEANVPEYVKAQFQEEFQNLGRQQASAYSQLSYGWEARLNSNILGGSGNMSMIANRFSYRDAVGAGVKNPHFGGKMDDRPMFAKYADEVLSIAGSTGTPQGFGVTALAGQLGAGSDRYVRGSGGVPGLSEPGGRGDQDASKIEITVLFKDAGGKEIGRSTKVLQGQGKNYGISTHEDVAKFVTMLEAGNH